MTNANNINSLLQSNRSQIHPLFEPDIAPSNTVMMDFSISNPEMKDLDFGNVILLDQYIFGKINTARKTYGYGGYMEDREIYRRSNLFDVGAGESRSIHLGVDIWIQAGKPIFCPLDARIHSYSNNSNYGDYGPTIILEHHLQNTVFFSLYGHLSAESLVASYEGKTIKKGEIIGTVGNFPVNGDWPPHLHFQIIADMNHYKGDFPGVCSKEDKEMYMDVCPDPRVFFLL
jgi:peptidoglycan LD-endopeptidase LytH